MEVKGRFWISLLVSLAILLYSPVSASQKGHFIAVISSHDLMNHWTEYKETVPTDYLIELVKWDELDPVLDDISKRSGGLPIFLDFHVHGSSDGLTLNWPIGKTSVSDTTNFGYILNHVWKKLGNRSVYICFESCYVGRAYKKTIRGMTTSQRTSAGVRLYEDFNGVPPFPVYGTGDSFKCFGQPMYIQWLTGKKRWWIDLRDYDTQGKNKPLSPTQPECVPIVVQDEEGKVKVKMVQPTTAEIWDVVDFYRNP